MSKNNSTLHALFALFITVSFLGNFQFVTADEIQSNEMCQMQSLGENA